jgi:AcrR family transcriptional regulator
MRTPSATRRARPAPSLTREQWADAALLSLAGGVEALAVEPLARQLGVTKGSFYWHFRDRAELLAAALERWEVLATDAIIGRLEAEPTARERLRALLVQVFSEDPRQEVEAAIAASAGHPQVQPVLVRVAERRVAYLETLYRGLGLGAAEARCWALQAYSTYVGLLHLSRSSPAVLRTRRGRGDYLRHLLRTLMP